MGRIKIRIIEGGGMMMRYQSRKLENRLNEP